MDGLTAFAIAGYSLGGNLTLKLAGDFGAEPAEGAARRLRRLADDGSGRVRGCARGTAERDLPVALRAET